MSEGAYTIPLSRKIELYGITAQYKEYKDYLNGDSSYIPGGSMLKLKMDSEKHDLSDKMVRDLDVKNEVERRVEAIEKAAKFAKIRYGVDVLESVRALPEEQTAFSYFFYILDGILPIA